MDAMKSKAHKTREAREAERKLYTQQLYAHWGNFSTIAVWEIAALMQGEDPENLQDVVINSQGDGVDLSREKRMLTSAITVGDLIAFPSGDGALSSETQVELKSLIPWLRGRGYDALADGLDAGVTSSTASTLGGTLVPISPVQRQAAQEAGILAELVNLGYNPLQLPKNDPGKSGVKAEVKRALGSKGIWNHVTVFDKAWERLLGDRRIVTTK